MRKNRETWKKKVRKFWKNTFRNSKKKKFSLSLQETITKKPHPFLFVIFLGKAIGMGQLLNNYTHLTFFIMLETSFSIYIISFFFVLLVVHSCFIFLCSCIYCVYISLFISMFILLLLVYIIVLVSLDGYWTISQNLYGKYPYGEEISSHLGIQGFYYYCFLVYVIPFTFNQSLSPFILCHPFNFLHIPFPPILYRTHIYIYIYYIQTPK